MEMTANEQGYRYFVSTPI